ncbi:MAG: formimidoylglutamase [Legionella sp.]|nr:MAG: formimidoylglutamase [Legionella sp.]
MFAQLPNYQPADPKLWQGREDTINERIFQNIRFLSSEQELLNKGKKTILIGFASDEGVIRNQGRPGAQLGPDAIKSQLAKLPCPKAVELIDLGLIRCENHDLEVAQKQFADIISFCQNQKHLTIGLGGGHEIAWAHYQGLAPHYPKLGIINFDAHFDLRPYAPGDLGTSGTPFSQIAADCANQQRPFHYCCLGIQQFGNTPSLFQRAKELQVPYLSAEQMIQQEQSTQLAFLDEFIKKVDHLYLTICLDVLAESVAPGVSAPQTLGLTPWQILPLLKHIIKTGKVVSFDIAELSPPLDQDKKTARLAALIIAELLDIN